jgi:F-type H+-transporting ATPase subunit delta
MLIAKEDGQADTYKDELAAFSELLEKDDDLRQAIVNPLYGSSGRKKVLESVLEKTGPSRVMASFMLLLFDKGRIAFLKDISEFYQKLVDELKGVARASIVSATELSSEAVEKIRAGLSQKTGKEIILDVQQDPGLIGGVVTKIGDLVLDGSIKTQLFKMRESFKRGESV